MAFPYFFRQTSRLLLYSGLWCVLYLSGSTALATHISGGMLTYASTGNNTLEIKLLLHFDEVNGNPVAIDQEVQLAAYNAGNGQFIGNITLPHTGQLPGPCAPQCGYCVSSQEYVKTGAMLPVPAAGMKLVFERCCRSPLVQNIPDPDERGIYISTVIPGVPNSSAVIAPPLPPLLFANTTNNFSAAATDADGDELHYRLDALYYGSSTSSNPITSQPPFSSQAGPWANGFSTLNMLSGSQPLQIDFNTGKMTAVPGLNGYFQIAYFVEEHRNNQLIGITRNEATVFVTEPTSACLVMAAPEQPEQAGWAAFPNPFLEQVTVQLPAGFADGGVTAELLDTRGRSFLTTQPLAVENGRAIISVGHLALPAGLYILRIQAPGQLYTFRLAHQSGN